MFCLEQRRMDIQPVKLSAAIHEIVKADCCAAFPSVSGSDLAGFDLDRLDHRFDPLAEIVVAKRYIGCHDF